MRVEIKLETMGYGLVEAVLLYWVVDIGDLVNPEQPILELSCDKEIFSLFSPAEGIIQETFFRAGETVAIGDVLGIIETDLKSFKPL